MSLSPELGPADVAAALRDRHRGRRATLVDRAHATGLLDPSHSAALPASLHRALARSSAPPDITTSNPRCCAHRSRMSTLSTDLALRAGRARAARCTAGRRAGRPRGARRGAPPRRHGCTGPPLTPAPTAPRWDRLADALALTGDCATAAARADDLLGSEDPAERAAAVRIAASVAIHDGNTGQAADLFRWLARVPGPTRRDRRRRRCDRVVAAGAVGRGARAGRTPTAGPAHRRPPAPTRSLAEGLLLTLDRPYAVAVARLGQAVGADAHASERNAGQRRRARHPGRAARRRPGAGAQRHRAGRARRCRRRDVRRAPAPAAAGWARMQDGQLRCGRRRRRRRRRRVDLHRRDALWAAALQTAIARRSGDSGALQKHWYAGDGGARRVLDRPVLPAAARRAVGGGRADAPDGPAAPALDEAFGLLEPLGDPPLWSVPLHWAGVHAGILANSPEAVAPHGQALTAAAAPTAPFAKALAGAGRTWLRVLANQVDVDEVTAAARGAGPVRPDLGCHPVGGPGRAADPRRRGSSGAMLQMARDLKLTTATTPDRARRTRTCRTAAPRRAVRGRPVVAAVRAGTRGRRTAAAGHAVPRHRQPAVHLGQDRRAPRGPDPAAGSAPNRGRRCCRCCARCWRTRSDAELTTAQLTTCRAGTQYRSSLGSGVNRAECQL